MLVFQVQLTSTFLQYSLRHSVLFSQTFVLLLLILYKKTNALTEKCPLPNLRSNKLLLNFLSATELHFAGRHHHHHQHLSSHRNYHLISRLLHRRFVESGKHYQFSFIIITIAIIPMTSQSCFHLFIPCHLHLQHARNYNLLLSIFN